MLDEAQDLRRETSELVQVVLSNHDKHGYSQAAYEARLQDLENIVALQEVSVKATEVAIKVLESFRNNWHVHYEQYGKHWAGLLDQRELALLILENADAALKQAEHDEQTLRDEKRDVQVRLNNARQQKIQAEKAHDKLSLFVETEWAKRETAIMKLEQLAAQIQRSKGTLCTQRERLERLSEIEKNKLSEKTLLNI